MSASTKAPQTIRNGGLSHPMRMRRSRRTSASWLPATKPGSALAFRAVLARRQLSHDPARKGGRPARSPLQDDP